MVTDDDNDDRQQTTDNRQRDKRPCRGLPLGWPNKKQLCIALWRRHAQTVRDGSSSYKIGYVIVIQNFLHLAGYQNPIGGSKAMGGFILLLELHWAGSAPAGLFLAVIFLSIQLWTA